MSGDGAAAATPKPAGRSRRRRLARLGAALGTALVLLVVALGVLALHLNSQIHRVGVKGLSRPTAGAASENILLVGSTSRCALKTQNPAYGLCSQGVTGVNGDVIMVLHLVPATRTVSILSIPRDTFIPNARVHGANKIDAALAEGPGQLVAAIQEDFAIPIQHFVELNFDTFAAVVNALGGVRMYFPEPVFDGYSGLNVSTPGCRLLNGVAALQVVRARHIQYRPPGFASSDVATWPQERQSDLARIRRDHEFLRVLAASVARQGLGNPLTDERIAAAVAPQLQVDSGLSATALVGLLRTFHSVSPQRAPQLTVPVAVTTFGPYLYKGGDYGDVVFPSEPQDQQVINRFLGVGSGIDTLTGKPLPAPSAVRVAVVNGSGISGQAARIATSLQGLGFAATADGNAAVASTQATETMVTYRSTADEPLAEAVARRLTGYVALNLRASRVPAGAQVALLTGTGLAVLPGAAPTASTSPGPSGAPSGVASPLPGPTVSGSSAPTAPATGIQPPSPSTQRLAPWDPRSCTSSGGEGP